MAVGILREADQASVNSHSAEVNLLLACGAAGVEPDETPRLDGLLSAKIDWSHFLRIAQEQRMVPQAYWRLRHVGDKIPADVLQHMHDAFRATLARKLLFTSRLLELLRVLEAATIRAMPFKGPILGLRYYGNVGLRDFEDLDILVDKRDVAAAEQVLLQHNFSHHRRPSPIQDQIRWESGHELSFINQDGHVVVELQWGFVEKHLYFSLPFPELWNRAERFSFGGMQVRILCPEDLLLVLCVHGAKHAWKHLIWICDVAQVLRRHPDIKWTEVVGRARQLGCQRILLLGLHLAHSMMGAPLPDEVSRRVQAEPGLHSLEIEVRTRILADQRGDGARPGTARFSRFSWFYLKARERLRDRLYYLFQFAITPSEEDLARANLPPKWSFIYSMIRPIRLSAGVLLGFIGSLFHKAVSRRVRLKSHVDHTP